ncbi:hypothetical protein R0K04_27455, partial [Pseudoalteromonas sp. SIMBA_153]
NPHLQSILPKFFAPKAPTYRRVVEKDSLDESDIAYDFYDAHPVDSTGVVVGTGGTGAGGGSTGTAATGSTGISLLGFTNNAHA